MLPTKKKNKICIENYIEKIKNKSEVVLKKCVPIQYQHQESS